ncbi:MAG: zinc-dependent metalloprotease [Saprospiraceae bacterium]|nr:zinc-dependent metalloprotease [Saprospiraceae bacterium]
MQRKFSTNGLICLVLTFNISAQIFGQQGDFFTVTTAPQGLSQGRLSFINNLSQDSATKRIEYVLFQDLAQHLSSGGVFSLKVLSEQNRFDLTPTYYDLQANGDYTYLGKMANEEGYAGLIRTSGRLSGFIQNHEAFWEIVPIDYGVSIIREIDISKFQKEICGIDHILQGYTEAELREMAVDLCDNDGGCGGIIDVLILVPPDVQEWYGTQFGNIWEVFGHFASSLFAFQAALINSGVEDIGLRFRTAPFDFEYSDPLNIDNDIFIELPISAADIRDEFRADLVVLLTSMNYPGIRGAARAGRIINGQFVWEAPSKHCAFVISEVQNNVNPTWTLAHEIAHLFGARHNRNNNVPCNNCGDNTDICTHGWRFNDGGQDRTIMSILFDDMITAGSQRVLHYSNPDIQFNGFDTGTADNNNTLGITNATCIIQHYQASPELGVTIGGSSLLCGLNGWVNPKTLTANVLEPATGFPGAPPYTYEWRWNLDGNFTSANPGTLMGTGTSVTINSVLGCPQFFLRVTVTASDGTKVHATRVINTILCAQCQPPNPLMNSDTNEFVSMVHSKSLLTSDVIRELKSNRYKVAPNPASDILVIERVNSIIKLFSVKILDVNGRLLLELDGQNTDRLEIKLDKCPTGMIWVFVCDEDGISIEKVIKFQK